MQVSFKRSMVGNSVRAQERKQRVDLLGERWLAPLPMFHAYVRKANAPTYRGPFG